MLARRGSQILAFTRRDAVRLGLLSTLLVAGLTLVLAFNDLRSMSETEDFLSVFGWLLLSIAVVTTLMARGAFPDDHPLACGVLGRSGTPVAAHFMNEADLLVVFGASFSNHTGITPKKTIIQVDFDQMALASSIPSMCRSGVKWE